MNNSSTQGWTFFNNSITAKYPYYLYEVVSCPDSEGVHKTGTSVPALPDDPAGFTAIVNDMTVPNMTKTSVCTHTP